MAPSNIEPYLLLHHQQKHIFSDPYPAFFLQGQSQPQQKTHVRVVQM